MRAALVARIDVAHTGERPVRVLIDGPRCARPADLADSLIAPLAALGRPAGHVRDTDFWRDASVRLEYGRTDELTYAEGWSDLSALRREVLDPVVELGTYLPSLRDPVSNRATRAEPVSLPATGVLLLSGELLIGRGLPTELTIHLAVSPAARRRRTDPEWQWTLPVLEEWDAEHDPAGSADVTIRWDDPVHPAVRGL